MTDKELSAINEKIHDELLRLKNDLERLTELVSPDALDGLDEVSRMDALVSKSMHEAGLASAKNRIAALEYALKRLGDDPEFGYCIECGEAIPVPRLLAMPETLRCVDCTE